MLLFSEVKYSDLLCILCIWCLVKELEISGIQDVRLKYKQNWMKHLERMDNTRLPKHALNYKPRGKETVDAPRNNGNASMLEQVKQPNPWRKMMVSSETIYANSF